MFYCRWRERDANIRGRFRSANKSGDLTILDNPKFHPLPLRLSNPLSLSLWEFLGEQVYSNDLLPFLDPFPLSPSLFGNIGSKGSEVRWQMSGISFHLISWSPRSFSFSFLSPGYYSLNILCECGLPIFPNIVFSRYDACNLGWAARVFNATRENRAYLWFEEFAGKFKQFSNLSDILFSK